MQWLERMRLSLRSTTGYQDLSKDAGRNERWERAVLGLVGQRGRRMRLWSIVTGVLLLSLLVTRMGTSSSITVTLLVAESQTPRIAAQFLHVLIPANHKDVNLCKTLVSASILNYPTPMLINWGQEFNSSNPLGEGKLSGVLEYINTLGPERDDDLVLVIDGYDTWMQLRPGVLIERYFDINERANCRIQSRLGQDAVLTERIQQRIIFSAQKQCSLDADDPGCYTAPESTLPRDVYGPQTDKYVLDEESPDIKFRPRYLNSGVGMGDVAAMRKLFGHALEKTKATANHESNQNIFAQIFGEQEFQREVIRRKYMNKNGGNRFQDSEPAALLIELADGSPFEFGIGLDYESLLGHSTMFAEYESEWIRHNDSTFITEISRIQGISPPRISRVPEDITRSLRPFWSANGAKDGLPQDLDWGNVPLHTNLWTGNVPAIIHHNAHIQNMGSLKETHWTRTWFQSHARTLMDLHTTEPYKPVAILKDAIQEVAYWSPFMTKWETRTSDPDQEWIWWEQSCRGFEEEIFRDGKGNWSSPRTDY